MEEPGSQKDQETRENKGGGLPPFLQPEPEGIKKNLRHKIFPINIDPAPKVRKAGGEEIAVVCLGQMEAE